MATPKKETHSSLRKPFRSAGKPLPVSATYRYPPSYPQNRHLPLVKLSPSSAPADQASRSHFAALATKKKRKSQQKKKKQETGNQVLEKSEKSKVPLKDLLRSRWFIEGDFAMFCFPIPKKSCSTVALDILEFFLLLARLVGFFLFGCRLGFEERVRISRGWGERFKKSGGL